MKKPLSILLSSLLVTSMCTMALPSFSATETTSKLLGDVNLDGKVNIRDATSIQMYLTGTKGLTDYQLKLANINGDKSVNISDATLIQKYLAGYTSSYKIGQEIETEETTSTTEATTQTTEATTQATTQTTTATVATTEPTTATQATTEATTAPVDTDKVATEIVYTNSGVTLYNSSSQVITSASNVNVTNNTYAEIVAPGEITVSGTCSNGQLSVNIDKTTYVDEASDLEITLAGLTLSNTSDSAIYIASIDDECALSIKKGTTNTISDGTSYTNADSDTGAIYSKDDLKIKGKGNLVVNGNCGYGICSKDDLKIWNSNITVTAKTTGIKGKDSVKIGDPDDINTSGAYDNLSVNITSGEDGIRSNNDTDTDKGLVRIEGGTVTINSQTDGIQAAQSLVVDGGTIDITTYKGSTTQVLSTSTAKGLKSDGDITLNNGTFTINSSDDSLHCADELTINGGTFSIASGDDGIHSDNKVTINDGTINITKSYEGVEGYYIYFNGGYTSLVSSDDGVNAAGGNDSSSPSMGGRPGPGGQTTSSGYLYITGGKIFVNASGDGLDANGTINMSGGLVIVSGPTNSGNGALDYDSSFTMTGGTLFAAGMSGMAQNVSSATNVCSAMITTSSTISANTTVAINDSTGKNLITVKLPKQYNSIVYASADLKTSSSYTLYSGGTYSGGSNLNNMYFYDGTYTAGTSLSTWTQSSSIYGSSGGQGGQGGQGGPGSRW